MSDRRKAAIGLSKESVRRIVLDKLRVVYRDWDLQGEPFEDMLSEPGARRDDPRAFVIALVAGLLGAVSEVIERNNKALAAGWRRLSHRRSGSRRSGLVQIGTLEGYRVEGSDGVIGQVHDVRFDDHTWTVRYLVVDTGGWLSGRKLLVSPHSVRGVDRPRHVIVAAVTREHVRSSPDIDTERPVSRRAEIGLLKYYGFPYYWTGRHRWGQRLYPKPLAVGGAVDSEHEPRGDDLEATHLRSVREVRHYTIHATDGETGHVEDFLLDVRTWAIGYMIVDTRRWWPGLRVLLPPEWIDYVSWIERTVHVNLPRETIRGAPAWDPLRPVDRPYEASLHAYYGRLKHSERPPAA
jgi:hypothetical protein